VCSSINIIIIIIIIIIVISSSSSSSSSSDGSRSEGLDRPKTLKSVDW